MTHEDVHIGSKGSFFLEASKLRKRLIEPFFGAIRDIQAARRSLLCGFSNV